MSKHDVRFPNESAAYRSSRDQLLDAEIALRRQTEAVAAMRRALPPGGEIRTDYVFDSEQGPLRMSDMFRDGKETLVIYNFMFGPKMDAPCPS